MNSNQVDAQAREAWISAALARYERPLVGYAYSIVHDLELARDVVQDCFLQLCRADRGKVEDQLGAWLYTVCRNRALTIRKKESRMGALPVEMAGPDDLVAAAVRNETQARILDVIRRMPAEQQEVFRLKFREDLNYREISRVMGISLGKVSSLICGALECLRHELLQNDMRTREMES